MAFCFAIDVFYFLVAFRCYGLLECCGDDWVFELVNAVMVGVG